MEKIAQYEGKNTDGKQQLPEIRLEIHIEMWTEWHSPCINDVLTVSGPVEADPEYRLIVAANNLTVEIDNELSESGMCLMWLSSLISCLREFGLLFFLRNVCWTVEYLPRAGSY